MNEAVVQRVRALPCWSGEVQPLAIEGGITNLNFLVSDGGRRFFVRTGVDIPIHGVMRFNELAAAKAAQRVGLSPPIVYCEPGLMVCEFIDGHTFAEQDVRQPENLARIVSLLKRCHGEMPDHFRGPALIFWVFHVIRNYIGELKTCSSSYMHLLPELADRTRRLETGVGPVQIVFGHNDLLAANFIDDGTRLWLIDWDYAGYNTPLFDLANLASNNGLSPDQENWLLTAYFEDRVPDAARRGFKAMKSASLLRETLWSMVSEIHSTLDFDYAEYTAEYLQRFNRVFDQDKEFFDHG